MGFSLLLLSICLVAIGTWNWVQEFKTRGRGDRRRKLLWGTVTLIGILLFFVLKVASDSSGMFTLFCNSMILLFICL